MGRLQRTVYSATWLSPDALRMWLETLAPREPTRVEIQAKGRAAARDTGRNRSCARKKKESSASAWSCCVRGSGAPLPVRSWMGLVMDIVRDASDAQLRAEIGVGRTQPQNIEECWAGDL